MAENRNPEPSAGNPTEMSRDEIVARIRVLVLKGRGLKASEREELVALNAEIRSTRGSRRIDLRE